MAKNAKEGYIVCFPIDPNGDPGTRGFIAVDPDSGQYYKGVPDQPNEWTALGQSPKPEGKHFPKNKSFTFDLCSRDNSMQLAWVVSYAPRPAADYVNRKWSPFNDTSLWNPDGKLVAASATPDSKGYYHYTLTTETLKNEGRFLFAMYACIVSGNGAGKAFAVDPEMEVSESIDGGGQ